MKNSAKSVVFTLFSVLFWAGAATAFKISLKYTTPVQLLLFSAFVSTIALFIVLLVQGKYSVLINLDKRFFLTSAVLGFINPFLFYNVLFEAYDLLPGQLAMALNFGWPITLTVLSIPILKQKLSLKQFISIFVSFVGAVIIATKGSFFSFSGVSQLGVILALGSTFIWASFWLVNTRDKHDPVVKLAMSFVFGLIYIFVYHILTGKISLPVKGAIAGIIYIGLFEMGITFVLWLSALKLSSSTARISNMIYLTPFLSLLVLYLVIGEQIYFSTFLGLLLIVLSIIYQELSGKKGS